MTSQLNHVLDNSSYVRLTYCVFNVSLNFSQNINCTFTHILSPTSQCLFIHPVHPPVYLPLMGQVQLSLPYPLYLTTVSQQSTWLDPITPLPHQLMLSLLAHHFHPTTASMITWSQPSTYAPLLWH
jgi:hypothetical protein